MSAKGKAEITHGRRNICERGGTVVTMVKSFEVSHFNVTITIAIEVIVTRHFYHL